MKYSGMWEIPKIEKLTFYWLSTTYLLLTALPPNLFIILISKNPFLCAFCFIM